jgi:hypothetical protein
MSGENIPETGLTEQERKAISERVLYEVQLRKSLEDEPNNRRNRFKAWLESNFAILLLGSIISSVLVPYFQQKQDTLTWQRQNRYDNLKYKLGEMRNCLEEFLALSAYSAALNEISKPILTSPQVTPEDFQRFETEYTDLKHKRFEQITKVIPKLIFFRHPEQIRTPSQDYIKAATEFSAKIEALAAARMAAAKNPVPDLQRLQQYREQVAGLSAEFSKVSALFDALVQAVRKQIDESERESEQF